MAIAFVIAHKYYAYYPSFLDMYICNIKKHYDCDVFVVDNQSADITTLLPLFTDKVHLMVNDSENKFELGAYRYALDRIGRYEHIVFTQDTFILRNKFSIHSIGKAATLVSFPWDNGHRHIYEQVLLRINLNNQYDECKGCWCNSFVLSDSVREDFMRLTDWPIIRTRRESEACERYLGRILLELGSSHPIDGDVGARGQCVDCDPLADTDFYFVKKCQQKNETTL